MKIRVKLPMLKETKEVTLEDGSTIEDLLKKINFKPDQIIVMSKNIPTPVDDVLKDGQELTIIKVASGG